MKSILTVILFLFSITGFAKNVSNNFVKDDSLSQKMSVESFKNQFELKGTIYVLSPDGKRLHSLGHQIREWKFNSEGELTNNWYFSSKDIEPISIRQQWNVQPNGQIKVKIEQFDNKDVDFDGDGQISYRSKPIKEKSFTLQNFEPITWVAHSNKRHRIVVRITPEIVTQNEPGEIGKLPISAKEMIVSDNKGFVWTPQATFRGQYVTLKTNRGTVHLSYSPFSGSKELGVVENNRMRIKIKDKHHLNLLSQSPFLPDGIKGKVYGKVNLGEKTAEGTTHIQTSDQEKEFLSSF